jgi:superfamily II DNA or RNA helicase
MTQETYDPIQTQIERRRQRAKEEIARLVNCGSHIAFSEFEVTSTSKRTYHVQIRSLTELTNSCTCPDYQTNLVGTCKHIEGVLLHLKDALGEQWDELILQAPPVNQVYLHQATQTTVRVSLPLPEQPTLHDLLNRYFDAEGILSGRVTQTLPALLKEIETLPAHERATLQVTEQVRRYLDQLQDLESIQRQKEWFLDQVNRGVRSLDVIGTRLYPYQQDGILHLTFGGRTMLADDMGLGKTVQAIAAAALLHQLRDIQRVLVVCPASLKHQWAREIQRFTSLPVNVVEGPLKNRRYSYRQPAFFTVINYELVRRDQPDLEKLRPDLIILDEAQRIKNWRTKTADAVKRLRSRHAFVLTGTPLENRLDELYSVFQFLDPKILGPLWRFNQRYFQLERRPSGSFKVLGYKNLDELRHCIAPYVLRRTRGEVLTDLPDRVDNNFFVEMTDAQWHAYEGFRQTVAQLIAKARRRPLTPQEHKILLGALIKMRLICNALALHDPDLSPKERERTAPKLHELHEILDDEIANNGHKAVVFSQWAKMLNLTEPVLDKLNLGYVKLTGDVPTSKRGALIEQFFEDDNTRVFLSTDAGGVGLNLQAASLVINLDLPWNPAVLEQRIGRAHRHGQLHTVNVINLIAQGTIEERMLDTLAAKRDVFAGVFGSEEAPAEITFVDTGQNLLKQLDELLSPAVTVTPVVELAPVAQEAPPVEALPRPTLRAFADLLVGRFPGRVLLVRRAPQLPGAPGDGNVLVVVDRDPAGLRPQVESLLNEHFAPAPPAPGLHLMEQEGYRALVALTGGALEQAPPEKETEVYRAPAMPAPSRTVTDVLQKRLRKAQEGFDNADRRLKLARVVLEGGFPEEVLRPVREALGWAFSAHIALIKDSTPGPELPAARLVHAELVESSRVPGDLANRLSTVRELSAPPAAEAGEETAPPPSLQTAETFITAVQELVDLGRQLAAEAGL